MSARRGTTGLLSAGLLGAALALFALPTAGQAQARDARWMPFVGCWAPSGQVQQDGMLCFRLAGDGVEVLSVADGEITDSEILVADGQPRTLSQEGCEGSESVRISDDGRRVYTDTEVVCEGGVVRDGSGLMSFTSPTQWLDVRSAEVDEQKVAWVQFYELVPAERVRAMGLEDPSEGLGLAVQSARMAASRRVRAADVVDASRQVDAKAVEAWIAERGEPFALDAQAIVALAEDDVPESVIDVMVAVSNPGTFTVDREGEARMAPQDRTASGNWRGYRGGIASPFYWDPFYRSYYRYGYGYRYSPFGYFGGGYYGGYYTPTTVIVDRVDDDRPRGRVVKGRGYTRGSTAGSTGRSYPTGRATTGQSSGASSSAGVSSRGSSSGSSTGRKAKKRGGGGGGF